MRENAAKKSELKAIVWKELEQLIKENVELQTKEIPTTSTPGSVSSSKADERWGKDDVDKKIVETMNMNMPDELIWAHRFVDEQLVPRFAAGFYDQGVAIDKEAYHKDTKDCDYSICLHAFVFVMFVSALQVKTMCALLVCLVRFGVAVVCESARACLSICAHAILLACETDVFVMHEELSTALACSR